MQNNLQKGVALVEVVVGIGIITIATVAISYSIISYTNAREALLSDVKQVYLVEEGYEMVRALRNDNWTNFESLALDTDLYLAISTTTITTTGSAEIIDTDYSRYFVLREVYRDSDDDITASTTAGASLDTGMREVEVYVGGPNGTTSVVGLLGNIFAL